MNTLIIVLFAVVAAVAAAPADVAAPVPIPAASVPAASVPAAPAPAAFVPAAPAPAALVPAARHANLVTEAVAEPIAIISQISEFEPNGDFKSEFETANGIHQSETGIIEGEGKDASISMKGHYSYTDLDGTLIDTEWYADKTGFHAKGAHISEIPEYISKALEYSAAHPEELVPEEEAPKKV